MEEIGRTMIHACDARAEACRPPWWTRCYAAAEKNGGYAQCARSSAAFIVVPDDAPLCSQHLEIFLAGKPVTLFRHGYPAMVRRIA
jgi:hypothetical protein